MDPSLVKGAHAGEGVYHGGSDSPSPSPDARRPSKTACPTPSFFGPVNCCDAPSSRQSKSRLQSDAGAPPSFGGGDDDERARLVDKSLSRLDEPRWDGHVDAGDTRRSESMLLLVLCPWLTFFAVALALTFFPPGVGFRLLAWTVFVLGLGFSALMAGVYKHSKVEVYRPLALLILLAVMMGCVAGRMLYDSIMLPYYSNADLPVLRGVLPSAVDAAARDAGGVEFVEGTKIDFRYTLGYRSAEEYPGTVFCVAPVRDFSSLEAAEVLYWAVGADCCEPSWGFACGAALSSTARSGRVFRDIPGSSRNSLWYRLFQEAAKQAAAMYRLGSAEEPVLVQWTEDASASMPSESWQRGLAYLGLMCLLYLMITMLLAGYVHTRWQPRPAAGKRRTQYDAFRP